MCDQPRIALPLYKRDNMFEWDVNSVLEPLTSNNLLRHVGDIQVVSYNRAQITLLLDILAQCPNLRTLLVEVSSDLIQDEINDIYRSSGQLSGAVTVELQAPLPFLECAQLGTRATLLLLPSLLHQARNLVYLTSQSPEIQLSHRVRELVGCGGGLRHLMLVGEDACGGLGMSQNLQIGTALKALRAYPDYALPSLLERSTRLRRLDIHTKDLNTVDHQWDELIANCTDAFVTPNARFIRELSIPRRFLKTDFRGGSAALLQMQTKTTPLTELQVDLSDDTNPKAPRRALQVLLASLKDRNSCLQRLRRLVITLSVSNMPSRQWGNPADLVHLPEELLAISRKRRICVRVMDDLELESMVKSEYFEPASQIALGNVH